MTVESAEETFPTGASADDLRTWTLALSGGPTVTHVQVQHCREESHGDDRPFWFFAEADASEGVARLRCVACGHSRALFDSEERWTYPQMYACASCEQSMVEVAVGVHAEVHGEGTPPVVTWSAVTARCVSCGRLSGLTDVLLEEPFPALEAIDSVL